MFHGKETMRIHVFIWYLLSDRTEIIIEMDS